MKRIRTIEINTEAKTMPENIAEYAISTIGDPTVITDAELTDASLADAKTWLASKENTTKKMSGYYAITVYAIERYTADEDGEFIEGSDFDAARKTQVWN